MMEKAPNKKGNETFFFPAVQDHDAVFIEADSLDEAIDKLAIIRK